MQTEIETRFLDIDKAALLAKLAALGARDLGDEKLDEVIYHAADGSWVGKRKFIRLRKTKDKVKLTYKENVAQAVDSAREIELTVSDMEKCGELFEKIGLIAMRRLEKYRHTFTLDDVTLDIDTWPKVPPYVELEGPSVEALQATSARLGLDWDKRFDGDAREVFRKYGYDMDKLTVITFDEFR